jgi:UDP-N-acetylmuramate dehydrogenase
MAVDLGESDVPLAPLTTLGVGGRARWFLKVSSVAAVARALHGRESQVPLLVLGGGSNLVVADEGWYGLVLHMAVPGLDVTPTEGGARVRAGAGESWDRVVASAVDRGLSGIECLSGIPGSVGGTPIQNVGAYGQEVADVIESVDVFDRQAADVQTLTGADCRFSYRTSRFKAEDAGRFIVCGITMRLKAGTPTFVYPDVVAHLERIGVTTPTVADVRRAVLAVRRGKGMVLDVSDQDTRSVGSFFMNPVVSRETRERLSVLAGTAAPGYEVPGGRVKVPAAWLIERAGFRKGDVEGGAAISTKHPLALVNRGGATARDIVRLAVRVKRGVEERFGVALQPEPVFVGFGSDSDVEYLRGT